jgi:hypothetical protein
MSAAASAQLNRAEINRANSQFSTGPRTEAGKKRVASNALRHGLTARTALLPSEDPAAYEQHCRQFRAEYQPANPTESQIVQELIDTSWRLNRIPLLETGLFDQTNRPECQPQTVIQSLAALGLHGARLSRQFHKALDQLHTIQEQRRYDERWQLKDAAAMLENHKRKGLPWDPADDGFVFSKDQVERHSQHLMRLNEARYREYVRFDFPVRRLEPSEW